MKQLGPEFEPIWDASIAGWSFTHYNTICPRAQRFGSWKSKIRWSQMKSQLAMSEQGKLNHGGILIPGEEARSCQVAGLLVFITYSCGNAALVIFSKDLVVHLLCHWEVVNGTYSLLTLGTLGLKCQQNYAPRIAFYFLYYTLKLKIRSCHPTRS